MELYFIRHAQSANNALYDATGSELGRNEDPELTEKGILQADYLARYIREGSPRGGRVEKTTGFGLTHLYCSLMVRAVATGVAIARQTGMSIQGWECIHECGGIYLDDPSSGERVGMAGKNQEYFLSQYPELDLPVGLDGKGWWGKRSYENEEERFPRAQQVLRDLLERHGDTLDRVALISHAGFYNEFLAAVLGGSRKKGVWFGLNNTGITRIDYRAGTYMVVYQNRTDHLPADLLT
jgi:2,3-bisphosphoglycerate-dependent phosphoglycerate mutase